jgi:hypothetical protein
MTVEQTRWFREEVEHFAHIGEEYRHTTNRDEIRDDLIQKTVRLRGKSATIMICKRANQKLHHQFYDWRKI